MQPPHYLLIIITFPLFFIKQNPLNNVTGHLTFFHASDWTVRAQATFEDHVGRAYQSIVSQQCVCRLKGQFSEEVGQQGLCVAGGSLVRYRLGLGRQRLGAFACMASGRRSTTLRGGSWFSFSWVWEFRAEQKIAKI